MEDNQGDGVGQLPFMEDNRSGGWALHGAGHCLPFVEDNQGEWDTYCSWRISRGTEWDTFHSWRIIEVVGGLSMEQNTAYLRTVVQLMEGKYFRPKMFQKDLKIYWLRRFDHTVWSSSGPA